MKTNLPEVYDDLRDPEGNLDDDLASLKSAFVLCSKVIANTAELEEFKNLVSDYRVLESDLWEKFKEARACKRKS